MKHSTFTLKWFCVVAAIFVACSSDSSSNASETDSSSSEFSGISSENLAESSSSQFSTLSSSESGDLDGDNPDVENTDTDTLSTSTWLSWEVPEAPSAGVYAAPDSAVLVTFSDAGISVLNAGTKSVSVSENILVIGSAKEGNNQSRQIMGLFLGLGAMILVSLIDYSFVLRFVWILYGMDLVLLTAVIAGFLCRWRQDENPSG